MGPIHHHLPEWDAIPDLGLYMDQVVVLLAQYLNFIPAMPGGKESFVTSSTINNYVRLKIMPAPVKRKYFRVHIAYLIMILTMKQSISISDVTRVSIIRLILKLREYMTPAKVFL